MAGLRVAASPDLPTRDQSQAKQDKWRLFATLSADPVTPDSQSGQELESLVTLHCLEIMISVKRFSLIFAQIFN